MEVVEGGEHVGDVVDSKCEQRGWKVVYSTVPRFIFILHLSEHIS